jgi:NAD(P)-dependent dehydrogenase (short-subunit alcohol dehydrogenase family)
MTQKTILVTGCSSGIGYDVIHQLRANKWRVFAACKQQADCDRLAGEGFETLRLDYTETDSIVQA